MDQRGDRVVIDRTDLGGNDFQQEFQSVAPGSLEQALDRRLLMSTDILAVTRMTKS
jgi:hypothetical protein